MVGRRKALQTMMKTRRQFLQKSAFATAACFSGLPRLGAAEIDASPLNEHRIDSIEIRRVKFHWPRPVGKNGRIGVHGQHHQTNVAILRTEQGAEGWGLTGWEAGRDVELGMGKTVGELFDPAKGIRDGVPKDFDFALHDLAGIILDLPVHEMLGGRGTKATPVYSGMIYFDELEPEDSPAGLDKVIENCAWDVDYGYRQLKVKIGRSGRWYPHDEGLKTDIEIVRRIHETFKDRGVEILVDANDMYSLEDAIAFLEGIGDVPLFWFEEPFQEEREKSRKLRDWMHANGFEKTYLADGEFRPDPKFCLELAKEGILDVNLHDTFGHGFTRWRSLMPKLVELDTLASPHAWGDRLKTHYTAQIAAGLGNCCTVEGVTCESDDIDYGDYPIKDGKIHVPDAPGFGMKLIG